MATEILNGALSKIGEYLLEATIHQLGYLFRFKSNVEDLKKNDENLRFALDRVQLEVDIAKRNTEEIEKDVEKWLNDVSNVIKEFQKLEEETKANKTCLSGLCSNLAWRYRLSKKAAKMTSTVLMLVESGKFNRVSHLGILTSIEVFSSQDFVAFESTKSTFDRIIEAMKDDKIKMVGIWGMGGVGKTTLAKEVANKVKELKIFNTIVFTTVSQTPNFKNIQGQMAEWLDLKLVDESEDRRAERLLMRLKNEKKILIILDDVWAKLNLKRIGVSFGDDHQGCKILVTTRRKKVCIDMEFESEIPLNVLKEEEGLALLKRNAGIGDQLPTLNDLAKQVARECKGLPLAIVTIGSALKGKTIDEWKVVSQKLKISKFVDVEDVDTNIYACLKLSYEYLKDKDTKLCFLLCSLFPEDYEIPLEKLVGYGRGLGLYEDANSIEEARSQLRVMINNLKASCLLLDGPSEEFVKMHDMVRDVALWITSSEGKKFMSRPGLGLREWPNDEGLEKYSAISLMGNELEVLPVGLLCPKLEILLVDCRVAEVSDQFFVEMKALKVVFLRKGYISLKSLQFLTNLGSLFLHDCKLKDVSSIGMLRRLEILSFRGSSFEELAKDLGELRKLRLLDLSDCNELKRIPANVIRRLSQLEELYIGLLSFYDWDVEGTGNASLCELNALSHLTILSLFVRDNRIPKDFTFPNLQSYFIGVNKPITYGQKFMLWMRSLWLRHTDAEDFARKSQSTLEIKHCRLTSFTAFQQLFPTLQILNVENLIGLRYIWKGCIQQLSLHNLLYVDVSLCERLTCVFTVSLARSLVRLQKLRVRDCNSINHIIAEEEIGDNILVGDGIEIVLPNLRELTLQRLTNFMGFCPHNYHSTWPALQTLVIGGPINLSPSFRMIKEADKNSQFLEMNNHTRLKDGLKNLEKLSISICEAKVIFHLDSFDVLSFPSLKDLELSNLEELEYIWKGPAHFLNMQNVSTLILKDCRILRHIFSMAVAQHLLQLEHLYIENCRALEQIIIQDDDVKECKEIVLRGVKKLQLQNLPSLLHFCPMGCQLIFPSLTLLKVKDCPKIATRLSVDQNESVHAKSEAPQIDNEEAPTMEIFGDSIDKIKEILPPYTEE